MRLAILLASLLVSNVALADALPPPLPIRCPPGEDIRHDHGGTRCEKRAPTNCPPGWRGVRGGACVLAVCDGNKDACQNGDVCKPIDLCSHVEQRWGENDTPRSSLFAAPPAPRKVRVISGVCAGTCTAPDECRAGSVCLPAKLAAPAPRPSNAAEAISMVLDPAPAAGSASASATASASASASTPTATPSTAPPEPPASTAPVPDPVAPAEPRPPGKSSGCAGCATSRSDAGGAGILFLVVALLVRRRHRR